MNPPFRRGTVHVVHAWELLFTGELVARIDAQDIRNPNSAERKQLTRLIADQVLPTLPRSVVDLQLFAGAENDIGLIHIDPAAHKETRNHAVYSVYVARTRDAAR